MKPLKSILFLLIVIALVVSGCTVGVTTREELTPQPSPTPTTSLGKLAYVKGGDIWVKTLPDGEPQRLTTDGRNREPRLSPSGQWLAFRKGDYQVWLMRDDGSAAHALNEGRTVGVFAWAPGKDRLAYTWGEEELEAINADGTDEAVLVPQSLSERIGGIDWSPDGTWIAYEWREQQPKQPVTSEGLWKVSADGEKRVKLYEGAATLAGWTGDSRFLLFWEGSIFASASGMADGAPLSAVPVDGGTPVRLAESVLGYPDFVAPTSTGTAQIAVIVGGYRAAWWGKSLHIVSASTRGDLALTAADVAASSPAWSPDGQRIAYFAMPDQGDLVGGEDARLGMMQRRIWVLNVEQKSQPRQLTDAPAYRDERPLWSADGSHILFARLDVEDRASLWLIAAEGGEPQQMVDELTPAPEWFGYYGHVEWDSLFDWWTGPPQLREAVATPTPGRVPTHVATVTPFPPFPTPTPGPTPTAGPLKDSVVKIQFFDEDGALLQNHYSGVVLGPDGEIVAAPLITHLVEVVLLDGRSFKAHVLKEDPMTSFSLLQIEDNLVSLASAGDSANLQVGDLAIAAGYGASGRYREIEALVSDTDAFLPPGTKGLIRIEPRTADGSWFESDTYRGGPLVDADGYVVGIILTPRGEYGSLVVPIERVRQWVLR